jgi:hypothetical protein
VEVAMRGVVSLSLVLLCALLALSLSGCAVIGGIFKAGVWVGVLAVFFVALVIFGLVRLVTTR